MERPTESLAEAGPRWFADHHDAAPRAIIDFLGGDGISLEGLRVADVGSGDGVIDLGLVQRAAPAELVGFDIVPTNAETLLERARTPASRRSCRPACRSRAPIPSICRRPTPASTS